MPRAGNLFKNCTIKWYTEDTADTENGFFQKWKKGKKKRNLIFVNNRQNSGNQQKTE